MTPRLDVGDIDMYVTLSDSCTSYLINVLVCEFDLKLEVLKTKQL